MRVLLTLVLGFAFLVAPGASDAQFGGFGDKLKKIKETTGLDLDSAKTVIAGYSYEEERAIGQQIMGNLLGAAPLVDDPALQEYVNLVGLWVAVQSDRADIDWVFGVLEDDSVNAFAAPGGLVLITKGLYQLIDSEAELAAVLAHEIVHVTEKHHLDLLRKGTAVNIGANLAKSQVGDSGGMANEAIQNLIGNGAEILARGLDKSSEYEADEKGMRLASDAGYTPMGMVEVVVALGNKSSNEGKSSMDLMLSTHPSPDARLDELDQAFDEKLEERLEFPELASRFSEHAVP